LASFDTQYRSTYDITENLTNFYVTS